MSFKQPPKSNTFGWSLSALSMQHQKQFDNPQIKKIISALICVKQHVSAAKLLHFIGNTATKLAEAKFCTILLPAHFQSVRAKI